MTSMFRYRRVVLLFSPPTSSNICKSSQPLAHVETFLSILKLLHKHTSLVICLVYLVIVTAYEPPHDKTNKMTCAPNEDSDQPWHPPVFAVRMRKHSTLHYLRWAVKKFVDTPNCAHLKSHFIFRQRCFHSLNKANIKKISAVVPEITELEHTWGSLSGPRDF